MNSSDQGLMHEEIHAIPDMIRSMADALDAGDSIEAKRLLVVGYGSNLNAARVLEHPLAARGVGLRFATPNQAVLLEGETLVCVTRSAASDDVIAFLREHKEGQPCVLLTANVTSTNALELGAHPGVTVVPLNVTRSRPTVATQSILAIIMVLDCLIAGQERTKLWRAFAHGLESRLHLMHEVASRRAVVARLADRLFIVGDDIMEHVALSLALTVMETSQLACVPLPLGAGTKGPILNMGQGDGVVLLGYDSDNMFARYRAYADYSLHISAPDDAHEIAQALYTLVSGQLLALELSRLV